MSGQQRPPLLVVPVADPARLASVCTLARVRGRLVPVEGAGCVLLPEPADGAQDAAAKLSRLVQGADVVLLALDGDVITAQRWRGGTRGQDAAAPGLLLSTWPDAVQGLLLGRLDPAHADGAREVGHGSRWKAAWGLARGRARG